jgi:hypothetical protein
MIMAGLSGLNAAHCEGASLQQDYARAGLLGIGALSCSIWMLSTMRDAKCAESHIPAISAGCVESLQGWRVICFTI